MKVQWPHLAAAILALQVTLSQAAIHYVNLNSANPVPPYGSWTTAATNIQDAVDSANSGDQVVVTNGIYQTGFRLANDGTTNRIAVTNSISLQSLNGSAGTLINGGHAMRCVYLGDGAVLMGFTLTNGYTGAGAGVWCASTNALVTSCLIVSNTASYGGGAYSGTLSNCTLALNVCATTGDGGGGVANAILNNCTLTGNVTGGNLTGSTSGGGAISCTLNNCTLSANRANGAGATGGGANTCILNNCTITGNSASYGGGGAYESVSSTCIFTGNSSGYSGGGVLGGSVSNSVLSGNGSGFGGGGNGDDLNMVNCIIMGNFASDGGGTSGGNLFNCLVVSNSAGYGGGAYYAQLHNCTITGNNASQTGGGEYESGLVNCINYYNTASSAPNNSSSTPGNIHSCCTPDLGVTRNITNAPLFGTGFQLLPNSPCINAGDNTAVYTTTDLAGLPRIAGGTVDIGAYEYQTPTSIISYAWLEQYGLAVDGSADYADADGDGMNNWQEWIAGTIPTNSLSVLKILSLTPTNNQSGWTVSWQSVNSRTYYLQRSTSLIVQSGFQSIQSNVVGQAGSTTFTDMTITNSGPYFYRVGIQ